MAQLLETNKLFLAAEDAALKAKLSGLQVESERGPANMTDVKVWFRWPAREYQNVDWPFITIDLVDFEVDHEREHSYQWDYMHYLSDTIAPTPGVSFLAPFPIPYTLTYVVATHCRSARHDRALAAQLEQPWLLPGRFGFLEVPTDGTTRRLDLLGVNTVNDLDSLQKRVFRRIFTIGISAEMLPDAALNLRTAINNVIVNMTPL